jgi:hypothetical protein
MLKSQPNRPGPASARPAGPEKKYYFFNVLFKRMPTRFGNCDRFIKY